MSTSKSFSPSILNKLKKKVEEGLLPQWVSTDPELFQLEREKVFGLTWNYLAHESELKEAGSFVTRWIVDDPILLLKNSSGEIKAFLNSCSHRGAHLCVADKGNQKTFTCPYHGWSYNNNGELIGITHGNKLYGEAMDKSEWGLRPINIGIYQGMIFGNLDPNAMPLEEFLGDMKWYLDVMLGRSDEGMEVIGVPQRWVLPANWKNTQENFQGDPYHLPFGHRSVTQIGLLPDIPFYPGYGHQVLTGHGSAINCLTDHNYQSPFPFQGTPESMWPMFQRNLTKEQLEVAKNTTNFVGGIFPNFSFLGNIGNSLDKIDRIKEGKVYNYLNLRVWRPLASDKVEVWNWCLVDKAFPEEYKKEAYRYYVQTFGSSGTFEADDSELYRRVIQANKGIMAQDKELSYNNVYNYLMGFEHIEPVEDFPGPGIAYPVCFHDAASTTLHEYWLELLMKDLPEEE
jgi:nitrite reductase/ring-hydroxylating ferredoxin subunit